MFDIINGFIKDIRIGEKPCIETCFCIENNILNNGIKSSITKKIELIINHKTNKKKTFKFGKTGHPNIRTDQNDYRANPYLFMYLLFKTTNKTHIESLEIYYSKKYYYHKRNANYDTKSLGKMRSYDGFYYLYLVI